MTPGTQHSDSVAKPLSSGSPRDVGDVYSSQVSDIGTDSALLFPDTDHQGERLTKYRKKKLKF